MSAEVRPARVADAAQIAAVHVLAWQRGYQGLMPQEYLDGLDPAGERLERWTRSLAEVDWSRGGTLVVAAGDGQVSGFAHIRESRDEDADLASGEIWAMYVMPAAWGKGLGRRLMAAALSQLAGIGYQRATLWVLATNTRARRFYEAAGFRPDGAVKDDDTRGFRIHEVRYARLLP